jgi:hypothetical protein
VRLFPASGEEIPFGADVGAETTFDGFTIPSHVRWSWRYGTERAEPFLETRVTSASYRDSRGPDRAAPVVSPR